uniref:Uncharacterized protein n=1 Tax=Anguilla anguilla TaxID=7936 RepID=A0A0E9WXC1_ANGAN
MLDCTFFKFSSSKACLFSTLNHCSCFSYIFQSLFRRFYKEYKNPSCLFFFFFFPFRTNMST